MLGLLGAGTAAAIGSVAVGWRQRFADAAGTRGTTPSAALASATATSAFTPAPGATVAGPADEITFIGSVDRVLNPAQFVGSNKSFSGITVDLSSTPAAKIYPTGHVPYEGDLFYSRGHWLGELGKSTWEIEFVDFNIYQIMGTLSRSGATTPGSNYTVVDMATKRSWQVVIEAANVTHFTIHGTSPTPTDALLSFPDGTSADIIGYEDRPARPGVLVATYLEIYP